RIVAPAWRLTLWRAPCTQQGPKPTGGGEAANGSFGDSGALSADGNTALIGGPVDNGNVGAAWVFTRSGSTWTQQGEKLTGGGEGGPGGIFGWGAPLSAGGNAPLRGGGGDDEQLGAGGGCSRGGSPTPQQDEKARGRGERGAGVLGNKVALPADGNTALIGGPGDNEQLGAAWVFTRSGSTWAQQGEKLTGGGESGRGVFGFSVALSADGGTALVGGVG